MGDVVEECHVIAFSICAMFAVDTRMPTWCFLSSSR